MKSSIAFDIDDLKTADIFIPAGNEPSAVLE